MSIASKAKHATELQQVINDLRIRQQEIKKQVSSLSGKGFIKALQALKTDNAYQAIKCEGAAYTIKAKVAILKDTERYLQDIENKLKAIKTQAWIKSIETSESRISSPVKPEWASDVKIVDAEDREVYRCVTCQGLIYADKLPLSVDTPNCPICDFASVVYKSSF